MEIPNVRKAKIEIVNGSLKRIFEWEYAVPVSIEQAKQDGRKMELPYQ